MSPKILIVDDRAENLVVLRKTLQATHAEVIQASSGNEALKLSMHHQFAVAIVDVQMPEMDGYEFAVLLRQEVKTAKIPIIFVSAVYADDWHIFKGYEAGAVDFLPKPFNPEQLLAKVDVFLQLYSQREYYREKLDYIGTTMKHEKDRANRLQLVAQRNKNASVLAARLATMIKYQGSTLDMMQECLRAVIDLTKTDAGIIFDYQQDSQCFTRLLSLGQCSQKPTTQRCQPFGEKYFTYVNSTTVMNTRQTNVQNLLGTPYLIAFIDPIKNLAIALGNHRENKFEKLAFEEEDRLLVESAINIINVLIEQRRSEGSALLTTQLFDSLTNDCETNISTIIATQESYASRNDRFGALLRSPNNIDRLPEVANLFTDRPKPFMVAHELHGIDALSVIPEPKSTCENGRDINVEAIADGVSSTLQKALSLEESRREVIEHLEYTNKILDATRNITKLIIRENTVDELLAKSCDLLVTAGVFSSACLQMWGKKNTNSSQNLFCSGDQTKLMLEHYAPYLNTLNQQHFEHVKRMEPPSDFASLSEENYVVVAIYHNTSVYGIIFGSLSHKSSIDQDIYDLLDDISTELGFAVHTRRREVSHRTQELELKLILDAADIGTWTFDLSKNIGSRSEHISRFLGYGAKSQRFTKQQWQANVHPEDVGVAWSAIEAHIAGESSSYNIEYRIISATGQWIWVIDRGRVIEWSDDGEAIILCGTQGDISARKQAEQEQTVLQNQLLQSQKLESIGRLAGGVAHDFNNLLSVIMGFSDLLLMDHHDSATKDKLQIIKEACDKAKGLTTQLLMLSRKQTIQPRVVDWNQSIMSSLNVYSRLIEENIDVRFEISESLPNILADSQQLDQVLANLLVNARDAVQQVTDPDHKPNIQISTHLVHFNTGVHSGNDNQQYVCLTVTDNGVGMTEDVKENIFEPFFSTKGLSKGTGLGLAMVFGILEQNNGFIEVESEVNLGTSFTVYWPVTEQQVSNENTEAEHSHLFGDGEVIYVVEDELDIRNYCQQMLTRFNYKVTLASSAEEVMHLIIDGNKPDLLLTDVVLPEKSGHQLAQEVQGLYPDIPILYCSGYTDDIIAQHGVIDPSVNLISKPFVSEQLLSRIKTLLQTSRTQ